MATLLIDTKKILDNIVILSDVLNRYDINWTLVSKVLCGHKGVLKHLLSYDKVKELHSIGDSRLSSLKVIKELDPQVRTMYLKPIEGRCIKQIIKCADYSFNTSLIMLKKLNKEAKLQDKLHNVILMIELGELREGILRDDIERYVEAIIDLPNINLVGLGTNLGCMYGIEPTRDKLIQLCLYKKIIEARYEKELNLISGGSSITLPLLEEGKVPKCINHFRIGEAAFFGRTPLYNKKYKGLRDDAFELRSQIIELKRKEIKPDGNVTSANIGHIKEYEGPCLNRHTTKTIVDFGLLDVDHKDLENKDLDMSFIGTSSDMSVYDLKENLSELEVGDMLSFKVRYLAAARLMLSKFINKRID